MPNWTETECSFVLPTKNEEKLKNLFLSHKAEENEGRKEFFRRTFLDNIDFERNKNGMSIAFVECECAWSAEGCMLNPGNVDPDDRSYHCISLDEAKDKLEIKRFTIRSFEPNMAFEESITYDADEGKEINYDSRDTYRDPRCDCVDEDEIPLDKDMEM